VAGGYSFLQEAKLMWGFVRKKLPPRNSILIIEEMCVFLLTESVSCGGRNSSENEEEKKINKSQKMVCVMVL
jgi:hypothetical protein